MNKFYYIHKSSRVKNSGLFSPFFSPAPLHYFVTLTIVPMAMALTIVPPPLSLHKHFNFLYKLASDALYTEKQAAIGKANELTLDKIVTTPRSTPISQSGFAFSHPDLIEENRLEFALPNLPFSQMQFIADPLLHSKYEEIAVTPGIEMTSIDGSFLLTSPQIEAANIYLANNPLSSSPAFVMPIPIEIEIQSIHPFANVQQETLSSNLERESEVALETETTYLDLISTNTNVVNPARSDTGDRTNELLAATALSCSSPPPNNPISSLFFDGDNNPDMAHEPDTVEEHKGHPLFNLQPYKTRIESWPTEIKFAVQNPIEDEMTYFKAMDKTFADTLLRYPTPRWFEKPEYLSPRYEDQRVRFIQDFLRNIEWNNTDFPDGLIKGHPYTGHGLIKGHPYTGQCPGRCSDLDEEFNYVRVQKVTGLLIKHRIVNAKDVEDSFSEFWS